MLDVGYALMVDSIPDANREEVMDRLDGTLRAIRPGTPARVAVGVDPAQWGFGPQAQAGHRAMMELAGGLPRPRQPRPRGGATRDSTTARRRRTPPPPS